eukprot:12145-Hanusia_phi.AAC.2
MEAKGTSDRLNAERLCCRGRRPLQSPGIEKTAASCKAITKLSLPSLIACCSDKGILKSLSINERKYKTTTAMEPEIALLMANLASVKVDDAILDPFCGSCGKVLCKNRG